MNVKVIHVKMVAPAQTWKMDMSVHVKVDLLGWNVKQVILDFISLWLYSPKVKTLVQMSFESEEVVHIHL